MLHSTADGGLAVTHLAPISATLPSGVFVNVSGDYPFGDDVTITLCGLPAGALTFPLLVRVPGWATAATILAKDIDQPNSCKMKRPKI